MGSHIDFTPENWTVLNMILGKKQLFFITLILYQFLQGRP